MVIAFTRTIILYLLIIAGIRLMGKRQVGELEPSELALELAGGDHCGRLIVTAAELLTDMLEEA